MRALWLSLPLTAGLAFFLAWSFGAGSRDHRNAPGRPDTVPAAVFFSASTPSAASPARGKPQPAADGILRDELIRKALESADLIAGVAEIMDREGEDHCADTRLVSLVEQLSAARLSELPALLDHFSGNDFVVKFVLGAWAKRDAAGALAWVDARPELNTEGVRAFVSGWTRADPEAALAWVEGRPLSAGSHELRSAAVEAMAETDPAATLEIMRSRGWAARDATMVLKLLQNWGGRDPSGALEGLRALSAEMSLPGKEESSSPATGGQTFQVMLKALLYGAFNRNPADAAALLSRLTPEELANSSQAAAAEVYARDPALCEPLFNAPPTDETARQLLKGLAGSNPGHMLSQANRISDPALLAEVLTQASGSHFSDGDAPVPPEALPSLKAALERLEDPETRARVSGNLCAAMVHSSPAFAAELWNSLTAEQQLSSNRRHNFFKTAASKDPRTALAAYEAGTPEVRAAALKSLCAGLAAGDPQAGLAMVLEQSSPEVKAESAATLFAYWMQSKPEEAGAALEQHAARLDLKAILDQSPQAGRFRSGDSGFHESAVGSALTRKIEELLGHTPETAPGP